MPRTWWSFMLPHFIITGTWGKVQPSQFGEERVLGAGPAKTPCPLGDSLRKPRGDLENGQVCSSLPPGGATCQHTQPSSLPLWIPEFGPVVCQSQSSDYWAFGETSSLGPDFPGVSAVKNLPAGDTGLIPGPEISPGTWNDNLLQHSCLENPMERGTWWAVVHGAQNWTQVSDQTTTSLGHSKTKQTGTVQSAFHRATNTNSCVHGNGFIL